VWAADKLKRPRLGAFGLWAFLTLALQLGNKCEALRRLDFGLSISCAYRLWKRFLHSQSHIRTTLAPRCPSPPLPRSLQPEAQTIAHLQTAFPQEECPIVAFQQQLQVAFLPPQPGRAPQP
jgi:hypothetical protein